MNTLYHSQMPSWLKRRVSSVAQDIVVNVGYTKGLEDISLPTRCQQSATAHNTQIYTQIYASGSAAVKDASWDSTSLDAADRMQAKVFWRSIEWLSRRMTLESGIDTILEFFENEFSRGRFAVCDRILREAFPQELPTSLLLAILTATLSAADRLKNRSYFVGRVTADLVNRYGATKASRLISGLE